MLVVFSPTNSTLTVDESLINKRYLPQDWPVDICVSSRKTLSGQVSLVVLLACHWSSKSGVKYSEPPELCINRLCGIWKDETHSFAEWVAGVNTFLRIRVRLPTDGTIGVDWGGSFLKPRCFDPGSRTKILVRK
jgi:hypothetical protein